MDILENFYPLYQENPNPSSSKSETSESDFEETKIIYSKKPKSKSRIAGNYDNWCVKHSDNLWYFWCMCKEHLDMNCLPFMDSIDYADFTLFCYKNSMRKLK